MFNAVRLTFTGLPDIEFDNNLATQGVTIFVVTPAGYGRFMEIVPAGGHWEIHSYNSLPTGNSLTLDADGFPVVQHG